ncbi:MAG: hypothetical protein Q7T11_00025 [Deltaproteobacteria bacterium]|nr:hypothetical protein [Deltaproteobacteria bacterium]
MNEADAKYIVIGGVAVILHGYARGTKDLDLLVDTSEENVRRLKEALGHLPDNAIAQMNDDEISRHTVVRIADEYVIDLMEKACRIGYEEAQNDIEWQEIDGVKIPLAGKEILIKMKDTIRPSDKADTEFLRYLIEEEKKRK